MKASRGSNLNITIHRVGLGDIDSARTSQTIRCEIGLATGPALIEEAYVPLLFLETRELERRLLEVAG